MQLLLLCFSSILGSTLGVFLPSFSTGTCPSDVKTTDIQLIDFYNNQPLYLTFARDTEENRLTDNVCYTYSKLPDGRNTVGYDSSVFVDGSRKVTTFLYEQQTPGVRIFSALKYIGKEYDIGCLTCNNGQINNIVFNCYTCGGEGSFLLGYSRTYRRIGEACLQKAKELGASQGLPQTYGFYSYPMNYPPHCVFQQRTIATNPLYPTAGLQHYSF